MYRTELQYDNYCKTASIVAMKSASYAVKCYTLFKRIRQLTVNVFRGFLSKYRSLIDAV